MRFASSNYAKQHAIIALTMAAYPKLSMKEDVAKECGVRNTVAKRPASFSLVTCVFLNVSIDAFC